MSSSVISDLQKINPSSIIELFTLQLSNSLHGATTIYRFHAGSSLKENGEIVWAGNTYQRFPIKAEGFAFQKGQLPRPTLTVSNALGTITAILLSVNETTTGNDLTGATVTRIRTLAKFLDHANFPQQKTSVTTLTPDPNDEETVTFLVKVANVGGVNIFVIDDANNPALTMKRASTYIFDQSDATNSGHPLAIKSDAGGAQTTTVSGTAGNPGASVTYQPAYPSAPNDLRYYCTVHGNAMGNTITMNDPNTISSTTFTDSIQVNPFGTPDPTAEFPQEIYTIDRKASENREVVVFELASVLDLAGIRVPKRQCTRAEFPSIGTVSG
tara:strand:+ start:33 stop:1013 length:981 start_codon:yes stop_codon:yes gene_type:complete